MSAQQTPTKRAPGRPRKHQTEEEKINADRERRRKYYLEHREIYIERSRKWRAVRKAAIEV